VIYWGPFEDESDSQDESDYEAGSNFDSAFYGSDSLLRDPLEAALSAIHRDVPQPGQESDWKIPDWTIQPTHLEALRAVLAQWRAASITSANPRPYLAYPLYENPFAAEPDDDGWCNIPLIAEVERYCRELGFSVFVATTYQIREERYNDLDRVLQLGL
jgi:hypothetical protein